MATAATGIGRHDSEPTFSTPAKALVRQKG